MKRCVCNNVQRRAHAYKPTIWRDDKIFKVNINNNTNGCTLIINSPIARRPKAFQQNKTYHGIGLDNSSKIFSHYFT
jgi:hypothetical protein